MTFVFSRQMTRGLTRSLLCKTLETILQKLEASKNQVSYSMSLNNQDSQIQMKNKKTLHYDSSDQKPVFSPVSVSTKRGISEN